MSTLREVLVAAGLETRLEEATHVLEKEATSAPWYVRLAVGAGTWIGALCVGFALMASGLAESAPASVVVGLLLVGAAMFVSRRSRWIATPQIVLVSSFGGQALVLMHLLKDVGQTTASIIIAIVQLALLLAVRDATHRFLSAGAAVISLWAALHPPDTLALLVPAVALVIAVELLLRDSSIASLGGSGLARPAAYGAAMSVLGIHIFQALWGVIERPDGSEESFFSLGPVLVAAAAIIVGVRALVQAGRASGWPSGRLAVATAVPILVTVALSLRVPGLAVAFVLLVVAHARREIVLTGLTSAALALFLGVFYYSLEITLLEKSAWLVGTGVSFLLAFAAGFRHDDRAFPVAEGVRRWTRQQAVVAAAAVVTILFVSGLAVSRETIRRTGTRVLLPLAPVDPRSLIQGDYMVLDYELTRDVMTRLGRPRAVDATVLVSLDPSDVGTLVAINPGREPGPNEALVRVRIRDHAGRIGAESFFFEEGEARRYEEARFAELRVSKSGVVLLTGLVDEALEPIGERR